MVAIQRGKKKKKVNKEAIKRVRKVGSTQPGLDGIYWVH